MNTTSGELLEFIGEIHYAGHTSQWHPLLNKLIDITHSKCSFVFNLNKNKNKNKNNNGLVLAGELELVLSNKVKNL